MQRSDRDSNVFRVLAAPLLVRLAQGAVSVSLSWSSSVALPHEYEHCVYVCEMLFLII